MNDMSTEHNGQIDMTVVNIQQQIYSYVKC